MQVKPLPTSGANRLGWGGRFLRKPLSRQLTWIWMVAGCMLTLVLTAALVEYQFVHSRRMDVADFATSGVLASMQQSTDEAITHVGHDLNHGERIYKALDDIKATNPFSETQRIALKTTLTALEPFVILQADGQPFWLGQALDAEQLKLRSAAFAQHQRSNTGQTLISDPIKNDSTGVWSLALSRRITTNEGRFLGVVIAHYDLTRLAEAFASSRYLSNSESLLMRLDGRVLMRVTETGASYPGSAEPIAEHITRAAKAGGGGNVGIQTGSDGVERLYVWRALTTSDLVVVKGVALSSINKIAQPVMLLIGALVLLVSLLLLVATVWLHLYVKQVNVTLNARQIAEQARRKNEARLNQALTGSASAEWELQLPEARLYVSQRLAALVGLPEGDSFLDQAQWQALIHAEDLDTLLNSLARILRDAYEGEGTVVRVRSGPDSYNWLALDGRVSQRNATGQAVTITGLARDVTEQQRASDMVRDRTAQLDAIFRLSPDGYVSFDEHHKVKFVNPAFVTMTGWDAAEVKGLSEDDFSTRLGQLCIPERPLRSLATLRHAALQTGDIPSDVIELTGTPRRIVRVSLQLSHAPTVTQILYMRDVTHETMVEDMKTEFLATAAHELRTPMASIVGFAEILCTHPLPPADQLEFAQIIWRQSLHLAGILDELLDLSRIEARGGKGLLFETLDLRTQLAEVIHAFALPKGRDAPLVTLPPLPCKADSGKSRQVIENVLSNAYKYSGPGTAVNIQLAEPSQHPVSGRALVGLVIRDAGIGMTSEQLSRVYERFYRADKTGAVPGNGLGLSITREIMGLLNGQISISSAPQQGTAVTLLFPVADAPAVELPAQAPAVPPTVG